MLFTLVVFTLLCGGSVDLGAFVLIVVFVCYDVFTGLRLLDLIVGLFVSL